MGLLLRGGIPLEGDPLGTVALTLGLLLALWGLEALLGHLFPKAFQETERLHRELGRALAGGKTPLPYLFLALFSALGEEVFFRGLLQGLLVEGFGAYGIPLQALLFALLHPAPPRAWVYPLYAGLAGLLLGLALALSGSLVPGILAHFLHNARGFYEAMGNPRGPEVEE